LTTPDWLKAHGGLTSPRSEIREVPNATALEREDRPSVIGMAKLKDSIG